MKDNKLIAEFMGYKKSIGVTYHKKNKIVTEKSFKYDTDWNWLMQVVDKIESIDDGEYDVNILKNGTQIINYKAGGVVICDNVGQISYSEKIEHVYQAAVNFIKWYNEQNEIQYGN